MSGKDYVIKYSAMDQLYLLICNRISGWYNELSGWSDEYAGLVDMGSFQGTSAESAKAYLQEVHGLLICFVQQTLQVYQSRYLLYKKGYYDIDGSIYANIPQEALQDVQKKLRDESDNLQNISDSISSSVNSVSDLIYLKNPSIFTLKDTMDGLKQELKEFDQQIESYESSELTAVQGEMQGLIDSLQTAIQGYLTNGTNIASYQPGSVAGNTDILDLYQRAMAGSEYVEEHKEEIELAAAEQEEAFAQMQADYEAACEAREAEGQAKLIQGGLAIVIGTIAIVGTAGMATPIVITAGVAGGSAIAYGASTSIEGAQNWYLGSIGDLETAAVNPIRDTVFAGNQELYDLWGSLSMTVAGMCVPVGQSINGVAGMGKDVLVKTAIKTIAKETVQDTISDAISGEITEFATEKLNLNEAWSAALNIGISLGLDEGMDFAGQKIGVSKKTSFADDMSFDDAKRYNQYWDELEKGVHIDHPGLTQADIDAWNLADAKLDEYIAVSKVDTDAILELRMKELERQRRFLNGDGENAAGFTGDMNFDDAKRYNQYWDELEKGVHIDHPGLTQADIDAWKLADAKLDEHIAVSKVDTNAVVELRAKEAAAQESFIRLKNNTGESDSKSVIYGSDDIANYQYNMIENPGPLANMPNQPWKNFYGGRYNVEVLSEDRIMYRGGNSTNPYGRWFTSEPPESVVKVRIDTAVRPQWIDPVTGGLTGESVVDTVYAIKIPKGTTIYTGPVGTQGGMYVGGYDVMQSYIDAPWAFEVVGVTSLK